MYLHRAALIIGRLRIGIVFTFLERLVRLNDNICFLDQITWLCGQLDRTFRVLFNG